MTASLQQEHRRTVHQGTETRMTGALFARLARGLRAGRGLARSRSDIMHRYDRWRPGPCAPDRAATMPVTAGSHADGVTATLDRIQRISVTA